MNNEPDYKILSKNLADVLYDIRKVIDAGPNTSKWNKVMPSVDAALEQYEDLTVQEMELEREGLLDIVIYNKKVYYRIQYTNPYTYSIWWHRVKEDTTSLLKMVEDDEMVKKLEVAFNNDIASIRNFEKCKKTVDKWKKPQEPEEEPEELKTLYQMFDGEQYYHRDKIWHIVKRWMSQYTHNVMTGEYLKGYEECLTVLEENLK